MKIAGWFRFWQVRAIVGIGVCVPFLLWYFGSMNCAVEDCFGLRRYSTALGLLPPVLTLGFIFLPLTFFWEEHIAPRLKPDEETKWPDGPDA
jgi:hypothetical protein